jgi:hypothetical protein
MRCGPAQLRSRRSLANSGINKQYATGWMIIGGEAMGRVIGVGMVEVGGCKILA